MVDISRWMKWAICAVLCCMHVLSVHATSTSGTVRNVDVSNGQVVTGGASGSNGTIWEDDERLDVEESDVDYYMTWDDDFLYIGKISHIFLDETKNRPFLRENEIPFVFYIHAEYPGAEFSDFRPYEDHDLNFSVMGGVNFSYFMRDDRDAFYWTGGYDEAGYHEYRTFNSGAWDAANTVNHPPVYYQDGTARSNMEIAIPWDAITGGNGTPDHFKIFFLQFRFDPYGAEGCGTIDHMIINESPWGDETNGPTVAVNDGNGTADTPPNPDGCGQENASITRWWGCYPVVGGISPNSFDGYSTDSDAGDDQTLCEENTTNLAALDDEGTWQWISKPVGASDPIIDDENQPTTGVSNLDGYGDYEFVWLASGNSCATYLPDTMVITRFEDGAPASVLADFEVCEDFATIQATDTDAGTEFWEAIGAGNITAINSATTTVTGLPSSEARFVWHVQHEGCNETTDTLAIFRYLTPTASVSDLANPVCGALNTDLAGNDPQGIQSTATGMWSVVEGDEDHVFLDDSSIYNTNLVIDTGGYFALEWIVENGICAQARDTVATQVYNQPFAMAGADTNLTNQSGYQLAANNPLLIQASATGFWQWIENPSNAQLSDSTQYNTTISNLAPNRYRLVWNVTNGNCLPVSDTVQIAVFQSPTAEAGADIDLCDATTTTLSANDPSTVQSTATGLWEVVEGPTGWNLADATQYNTQITGLDTGAYTLTWQITNDGITATDTLQIVVGASVNAMTASDGGFCEGDTMLVSANNPLDFQSTARGEWSQVSGPASVIIKEKSSPSTEIENADAEGTYVFRWTLTNPGCPSDSDDISMVRRLQEIAQTQADVDYCEVDTVWVTGNSPNQSQAVWSLISGDLSLLVTAGDSAQLSDLAYGAHQLLYEFQDTYCATTSDTLTIENFQTPSAAVAMNDTILCEVDSLAIWAQQPLVGEGGWQVQSGDLVIPDSTPTFNIDFLPIGELELIWTVSNGSCAANSQTVNIVNSLNPELSLPTSYDIDDNIRSSFPVTTGEVVEAIWIPTEGLSDSTVVSPTIQITDDAWYRLTVVDEFGCQSTDSVLFRVAKLIEPPNTFTPTTEGGGENDTWEIEYLDRYTEAIVTIYNRWGDVLFESDRGYPNPWDGKVNGKVVPFGVYFYVIQLEDGREPLKGTLFVIR